MVKRRGLLTAAAAAAMAAPLGTLPALARAHRVKVMDSVQALDRSADAWRELVSPAAWRVLFMEDTERPGSSPLNDEKRAGTFVCAACYLPLFSSKHKYDSGTGWPSFWRPIANSHIGKKKDYQLVWPRTEYHCRRCGGHQGHVFDDGPRPTGQRWCNNGVALAFVPEDEPLPELRG